MDSRHETSWERAWILPKINIHIQHDKMLQYQTRLSHTHTHAAAQKQQQQRKKGEKN